MGKELVRCEVCDKECKGTQAFASHIKSHGTAEATKTKKGRAEVKLWLKTQGFQTLYISVDGVTNGNPTQALFRGEVDIVHTTTTRFFDSEPKTDPDCSR
jgi:hypothetical protein